MSSDKHKELLKLIPELDKPPPSDSKEYLKWLKACAHLDFLKENANSDEIIMFAQSEHSIVYTAVITNERLLSLDEKTLLCWDGTPYRHAASDDPGSEQNFFAQRVFPSELSDDSDGVTQMIIVRTFKGPNDGRNYFGIRQDYVHATDIHWQTEHDAFVKYENGGLSHVVSATHDQKSNISLVTFQRDPLEEYLVVTNSSLIRSFDFTLHRGYSSNSQVNLKIEYKNFFYNQENSGNTSYAAGIQIIPPKRKSSEIFKQLSERY